MFLLSLQSSKPTITPGAVRSNFCSTRLPHRSRRRLFCAGSHDCFRAIHVAVTALKLCFQFHLELRKIDEIHSVNFYRELDPPCRSCAKPTMKCTASSRTLFVVFFGSK